LIKPSDLHKVWSAPDNTRLTAKQSSYRHPVSVAAKISALCEMYPSRSRTDIVNDLLSSALLDVERSFPSVCGRSQGHDPHSGEELFEDIGPGAVFRRLANKAYLDLERELGNKEPGLLYSGELVCTKKNES